MRRVGGRLRITVRLTDAHSNVNLWAERFDRPLEDLFDVQEDLSNRIAALVNGQVGREGLRRVRRRPPGNLDAYDLYLQGLELHGLATEADTLMARQMFDRAIAADPGYAPAYAYQAYTVQRGFTFGWGEPRGRAALDAARVFANRGVALEPDSSLCMIRLALVLALSGSHDEAVEIAGTAVKVNPCDASGAGELRRGIEHGGIPCGGHRGIAHRAIAGPVPSAVLVGNNRSGAGACWPTGGGSGWSCAAVWRVRRITARVTVRLWSLA